MLESRGVPLGAGKHRDDSKRFHGESLEWGNCFRSSQILPWRRCGVRIRISMASSAFLCESRSAVPE